ncbi:MAG: InlB B-repeat-containing protein [Oscillibacter sp.]|nr:InlB B-repeat-containing protein [Oscillibacter sp.]
MKFIKKAAALFFCLALALSVMAISASASGEYFEISLEKASDSHSDYNGNNTPDYAVGDTVTYNIVLKATSTATESSYSVNAIEFKLALTDWEAANATVKFGSMTDATPANTSGVYTYEAKNASDASPWTVTTTGTNIGTIEFALPTANKQPTVNITDCNLHTDETNHTESYLVATPTQAVGGVEVDTQYTITVVDYNFGENGIKGNASTPVVYTYGLMSGGPLDSSGNAATIAVPTSTNGYDANGYTISGGTRWATGNITTAIDSNYFTDKASSSAKYGNVDLTADYSLKSFTVAYNVNGHGTAPEATTYTIETAASALFPTLSADGYTFGGWQVSATNNSDTVASPWDTGATYTSSSNAAKYSAIGVTLTAQWSPTPYNVSYTNTKGVGTLTTTTNTYNIETNNSTLFPTLSAPGYTFDGWKVTGTSVGNWGTDAYKATDDNGNTAVGVYGTAADDTITLDAQWTADQYNVSYQGVEGATGMPAPPLSKYTIETTAADLFPVLTKTGYTFGGWLATATDDSLDSPWTSTPYTSASAAGLYNDNVTLTAQWTAIEYNVSYVSDIGTAPATPTTYTIETPYSTLFPDMTVTGYTFKGWKVSGTPAGSWTAEAYQATDSNETTAGLYSTNAGDAVVLEAQWDVAGYYKAVTYMYAASSSEKLILFAVASPAGKYFYKNTEMYEVDSKYAALFTEDVSNCTIYATIASAGSVADVTFTEGRNTKITYNGKVTSGSLIDSGDYGTVGTILATQNNYSYTDIDIPTRLKMNTSHIAAEGSREPLSPDTESVGNILDIKAIMNLAGTTPASGN